MIEINIKNMKNKLTKIVSEQEAEAIIDAIDVNNLSLINYNDIVKFSAIKRDDTKKVAFMLRREYNLGRSSFNSRINYINFISIIFGAYEWEYTLIKRYKYRPSPIEIEIKNRVMISLGNITPIEVFVIRERFHIGSNPFQKGTKTLDEVGEKLKKTTENIRQIERKGLRKLRHPTNNKLKFIYEIFENEHQMYK